MRRQEINSARNAEAGPQYSQAVSYGNLLFTTGQLPVDAEGKTVGDNIVDQARQVFANLGNILEEAGSSFSNVIRTTIYVTHLHSIAELASLRSEVFGDVRPASVGIEVPRFWDSEHLIEIEVVAAIPQ
ncbi:2-iminobutanoate/2-iminopropanoate deaminase [Arthrobacter sp. 49Tsu3.1M3]|uniref:RidA family protein n=1 Tax=Arthrobacter sp. 49Tsu3.1M3 TaxID=1279029 RepID=UPI0009D0735E|nr:RidA family protein [Arthrobacter sp. 49Tsu3.1M3]SKB43927.1 2-iminobutanoate/2-iminopropanoate deaminase [Arthrobacter sp. 49Tsu3.1M3]